MTTGTINRTSANGLTIYQKTWAGTNGLTTENPYSCDLRVISKKKCEYWNVGWYNGKEFARSRNPSADYCYYDSNLPVLAPTGNQDLQALSKLYSAIRGHDFNLAVSGAESKQTIDLVRNSVLSIVTGLTLVLKGDFYGAWKQLRFTPGQKTFEKLRKKVQLGDFSGALLAIRYGWEPLLQDLYAAVKAVEMRTKKRGLTFRSTQTVTKSAECSVDPARYPMAGQQTCSIKYKVVLSEQISSARSLGLLDPAVVVWEKLPWSFVFDWFIPIGTYLESLSYFGRFEGKALRTVYQLTAVALVNQSVWKNGRVTGDDWLANMSFVGKRIVIARTYGPISVPTPSLKSLEKAFSRRHLENAAALIHQVVAGSKSGLHFRLR